MNSQPTPPAPPQPETSNPTTPTPQPTTTPTRPNIALITIFAVILLSLLIISGYLYYQNQQLTQKLAGVESKQNVSETQTPADTETATKDNPTYDVSLDVETWKSFTSPYGFTFKYPSEWGDVEEKITDADEKRIGQYGKTYVLTFSNIDYENVGIDGQVYGAGHSSDFSAGRGALDTDYLGNPDSPTGVTANVWAKPTVCISYFSADSYYGRIDFNLPGKEISGVRLLMPVISRDQIKVLDSDYEALSEEELDNVCAYENMEKEAVAYINELEEKDLDELSMKQLFVFKEILNSSSVN